MTEPISAVRVGTRSSMLARAQTRLAVEALLTAYPTLDIDEHPITTLGDQVTDVPLAQIAGSGDGGGVFTSALERALLDGRIDLAVHSAKDLPTQITPGLILPAVLPRADVRDALISRAGYTLNTLPHAAVIGTSSTRRAAQIRALRPDLIVRDLRGNVDTRLKKALAPDGGYDAILLAFAGLDRLGRADVISELLPIDVMLPAPAQGAIVLQVRDLDSWAMLCRPIDHTPTHAAILAERAFLSDLGSGCALAVGAYAIVQDDHLRLRGRVLSPDGATQIDVEQSAPLGDAPLDDARQLGLALAELSLSRGARALLMSGAAS